MEAAVERDRRQAPEARARPDICVIANAGSGKAGGDDRRQAIEAAADRHPGRFEVRMAGRGAALEQMAREAVEEGFATVVAGGGDGTMAAVAAALAGTGVRMGVLPLGTFNYFARSLELPQEIGPALDVVAAGHTREIDVGEVNGRLFLNNASLGVYPSILAEREAVYRRWGRSRLVAYWSVLVTLLGFRRPLRLTLTVDGAARRLRTPLVFVVKNARQLEELGLEGAGCIERAGLAVFVAPDIGRLGLALAALRLVLRLSEPRVDFELLCGGEVTIETARSPRLVARDGEQERMAGPYRFRLRRGALKVIVPEGAV